MELVISGESAIVHADPSGKYPLRTLWPINDEALDLEISKGSISNGRGTYS